MKRWGALLVLIGLGSFILPLFGMQFRAINVTGGDPSSSGLLFIIAGAGLFFIGQALERRTRPTPPASVGVRPPQPPPVPAPSRSVQTPSPAPAAGGPNFCGSCGTRLARPMKFCTACGAPIQ